MRKVLAVSGGVDSMVMLDLMRKKYPAEELVVATFDHGTRESSGEDADFVSQICSALQLKVYRGEAQLGAGVSEEYARKRRYVFLQEIAEKEKGEICTAHHLDDLAESIAINLTRGTGFRGLAVLNMPRVKRPFLDETFEKLFDKHDVLGYAAENGVIYRQDPTNTSDDYLRNRLRPKVAGLTRETKEQLYQLWQEQVRIVHEIDNIVQSLIPEDLKFERAWFKDIDDKVAMEILRAGLLKIGASATRPQIHDFLDAIREYESGKKFNLPNDRLVRIGHRDFTLEI